jgi:hypothetical protein
MSRQHRCPAQGRWQCHLRLGVLPAPLPPVDWPSPGPGRSRNLCGIPRRSKIGFAAASCTGERVGNPAVLGDWAAAEERLVAIGRFIAAVLLSFLSVAFAVSSNGRLRRYEGSLERF